ncbi:MAG: hypothetical protein ACJAR2_002163 [Ilumatobacter sp.]|jgi:hypothetical protein
MNGDNVRARARRRHVERSVENIRRGPNEMMRFVDESALPAPKFAQASEGQEAHVAG